MPSYNEIGNDTALDYSIDTAVLCKFYAIGEVLT